jgi:hypothetical protein
MTQVSGYTTRTGKRVRTYQRGGRTVRLRTRTSLDSAVRTLARDTFGGGSAFGNSPGSYRNHLDFMAGLARGNANRKRITRSEVGSAARRARYGGSAHAKVEFLTLNAERRRRALARSGGKRRASLSGLRHSPSKSPAARTRVTRASVLNYSTLTLHGPNGKKITIDTRKPRYTKVGAHLSQADRAHIAKYHPEVGKSGPWTLASRQDADK